MKNRKLNELLASFMVMQHKVLNMHWNVRGEDFMPYHKLTEGLYDGLNDLIDPIAEKVSMNDEMPIGNLKGAIEMSIIKEMEAKHFKPSEVVEIVVKDLKELLDLAKDTETSQTIQPLLDEIFIFLDKQLWFFKSSK